MEIFSEQEKERLQNDRASTVRGRVVLKKKDAPLAPPVTFLKSQSLPVRTDQLLSQEKNTHSGQISPLQPWKPEGAWDAAALHGRPRTPDTELFSAGFEEMACAEELISEGISQVSWGSNPSSTISSCVAGTCYFPVLQIRHPPNGLKVLSVQVLTWGGGTGTKGAQGLQTATPRVRCSHYT